MSDVDVLIQRLDPGVPLPSRAHPGDAGLDLVTTHDATVLPGQRVLLPTGIAIALPAGYLAAIVPRSGLAVRHGLSIVNAPGIVDAGYRGEIKVTLLNTDPDAAYDIAAGDRIAQLIVMPVTRARFVPVTELSDSVRGEGGFGSTGYQQTGSPA